MNAFQKQIGVNAAADAVLQQANYLFDAAYEARDTQKRINAEMKRRRIERQIANGEARIEALRAPGVSSSSMPPGF